MGLLYGAGWQLDDVLSLSFDQILHVGECIALNRLDAAEMVVNPLAEALGGIKFSKGKVRTSKRSRDGKATTKRSDLTREQKDQVRIAQLGALGFNVG